MVKLIEPRIRVTTQIQGEDTAMDKMSWVE